MTTKPPSAIQESQPDSIEKMAYHSVSTIPAKEPNDRNRLAYHVWRWLRDGHGTLEEAIAESGARIHISRGEALNIIRDSLRQQGVALTED